MRNKLSLRNPLSQRASLLAVIMLTTFLTWTAGCTDARHRHKHQEVETGVTPPTETVNGDSQVIEAQERHQKKVEVTFSAPVKRLLEDDTRGIEHQRFLLELSNGTTVLVAHNTDLAPAVPIHEGDVLTLHGEYIWNKKGGVLHYTHHTTNRHEGGWIQCNGQTYQ